MGEATLLALAGALAVTLVAAPLGGHAEATTRAAHVPSGLVSADLLSIGTAPRSRTADRTTPMAASVPARLLLPAIGVDSALVDLDLRDDGSMQVPAEGFPAGWYTGAPTPGELGPAVLAGHVDWAGEPGVFAALHELEPGDEVTVGRADGSTAVFAVTEVAQFSKVAFPTDAVYGDLDHAGLRLITCGGTFDRTARSYVDNVVVFAELVEARAA